MSLVFSTKTLLGLPDLPDTGVYFVYDTEE